jgi:hypothetical protein
VYTGCDPHRITPPPVTKEYKDLKEKEDVLWNLELAYNERNGQEFAKLLDDGFEFYVSASDYAAGGIPPRWGLDDEILANDALFDENLEGPWRATNIDLALHFDEDEWVEIPRGGDESWYRIDVEYNITVQTVSGVDFKGNRLKAQLVVRPTEVDGEDIWRIVEWRDIGDDGAVASSAYTGAVAETSWGRIKAFYRGSFFRDLATQDDVLYNLELSYTMRSIVQFTRLLDDDFVFFFSEADYNEGGVPVSWDRPSEVGANTNLLDRHLDGPLRATGIDLRLTFTRGEWTEIPQGNDESWFSKEVEYNITVQTVSGVDYKGNRLKAQFIIRETVPAGETETVWQIVRWRDIGEGYWSFDGPASGAVKESSWGTIKALYQ